MVLTPYSTERNEVLLLYSLYSCTVYSMSVCTVVSHDITFKVRTVRIVFTAQ